MEFQKLMPAWVLHVQPRTIELLYSEIKNMHIYRFLPLKYFTLYTVNFNF